MSASWKLNAILSFRRTTLLVRATGAAGAAPSRFPPTIGDQTVQERRKILPAEGLEARLLLILHPGPDLVTADRTSPQFKQANDPAIAEVKGVTKAAKNVVTGHRPSLPEAGAFRKAKRGPGRSDPDTSADPCMRVAV